MSNKENKSLSESFLKAFGIKSHQVFGEHIIHEETERQALERKSRLLEQKLKAAKNGGFGDLRKLKEERDAVMYQLSTLAEDELSEDKKAMMAAGKEMEAYARKNGGIDKNDFMKASVMMKKGEIIKLQKFIDELDTEPREKIISIVQKHLKEQLGEAKNYEIKNNKIYISKANFRKVHKDFKNSTKGKERMMAYDPKYGSVSYAVVFTEDADLEEANLEEGWIAQIQDLLAQGVPMYEIIIAHIAIGGLVGQLGLIPALIIFDDWESWRRNRKKAKAAAMAKAQYYKENPEEFKKWQAQVKKKKSVMDRAKAFLKLKTLEESTLEEARGYGKKPVSQMTPKEKAEHDKRREEYKAYQKAKRNEEVEGAYDKAFDSKELAEKFAGAVGGIVREMSGKFYVFNKAALQEAASLELAKKVKDLDDETDEKKQEADLDKVDPKQAKKKFKDRDDKDIDNDGDVDGSDEYLHKRRKAISKAVSKRKEETKESVELDENVNALAKEFEKRITKGGALASDRIQDKERMAVLAMGKKKSVDMKALDAAIIKIMNRLNEELDEAKSDYETGHKDFSSAVQHAKAVVQKRGYEIEGEDWDKNVALGPRKPSRGKTNSYHIPVQKKGKSKKEMLHMQVYNDGNRYELNMYIQ